MTTRTRRIRKPRKNSHDPWESAPPLMGPMSPEEFRALAARILGPEKAEVALHGVDRDRRKPC